MIRKRTLQKVNFYSADLTFQSMIVEGHDLWSFAVSCKSHSTNSGTSALTNKTNVDPCNFDRRNNTIEAQRNFQFTAEDLNGK